MDHHQIMSELEDRLKGINQAIAALQGKGKGKGFNHTGNRRKRHMSAAARRRISEAQKKRWAKLKNKG